MKNFTMKQYDEHTSQAPAFSRRAMLRALGAAGVTGAAVGVLAGKAQSTVAVVTAAAGDAPDAATGTYHETEHIRRYYACARIF